MVYAEMLQRLDVREGQRPEDARRRFDAQLRVASWGAPGREAKPAGAVDDAAPWWWEGEEQASDSFLSAMGVSLDG